VVSVSPFFRRRPVRVVAPIVLLIAVTIGSDRGDGQQAVPFRNI
jgi:hypothetical protein